MQPQTLGKLGEMCGRIRGKEAVLNAFAGKSGRGVVFCWEKFVLKGRCENAVNVARCYLVTCIASGVNYVKFMLDSVPNYPWITAGFAECYEIRSRKNTDSFAVQRLPVADRLLCVMA